MPADRVLVVVEQLRRRVPGGIGSYAEGLLYGLRVLADQEVAARPGPTGERSGVGPSKVVPEVAADDVIGVLEVTLLASRAPGLPRPGDHVDPLPAHGWPLTTSALPGPVLTRAWDHGLVRAPTGYDVVHATSFAMPSRPWGAVTRGGRPALTVAVQDLLWREHPEASTRRGRRWHERSLRRTVADADAVIAPSLAVADRLTSAGMAPGAVTVVHPGCDHLPPADHRAAEELLAAHGVHGSFLLSVNTLEPRKNLARLVAAYESVLPSFPHPWPLVLVGPEGWGRVERTLGARGGRDDHVVTVGPAPAPVLAALYERARLLAYVPLSEGYGLPPMEAALRGTPVVASDQVPSVAEAPGDVPVAEVVDPVDGSAIAGALLRVATDERHATALAGAAQAVARQRTWAHAARAHVALWRSVAPR